jgi:hypothetical protein
MPLENLIQPFTGAFVFVETAAFGGSHSTLAKAANAHDVGAKLVSSRNVVFAHPLLGPSDLLVMIRGESPADLLKVLHRDIRSHQLDEHNYVLTTQSSIITSFFGGPINADTFVQKGKTSAWVLAKVGVPDPVQDIAEMLISRWEPGRPAGYGVVAVVPVLGVYDVFIFLQTNTLPELLKIVEDEIRPKRHFVSTDTRLVQW